MVAFTGERYKVNNIIINKILLHKLWKVPLKRKSWYTLHLDLCSKLLPFVLVFQSVRLPELIAISWRITYVEPCSPVCTTHRGRVTKCKFWGQAHACCVHVKLLQSCLTVRPYGLQPVHGILSTRFSRQEYWCGLPFPSLGDLPNPGIEPTFPALAGRFWATWEAITNTIKNFKKWST